MNDIMSMMEQDFEETMASSVEKLDQGGAITVASLARDIRSTEEVISDLEEVLKMTKAKLLKMTPKIGVALPPLPPAGAAAAAPERRNKRGKEDSLRQPGMHGERGVWRGAG